VPTAKRETARERREFDGSCWSPVAVTRSTAISICPYGSCCGVLRYAAQIPK
jgi:hypothetical protein